MMLERLWKRLCCLILSAVFANGTARAGGISLYEFGSPDVGLAGAGYAARAQDAATVFTNPAGMSRLEKSQVMGSLQALYGDVEFNLGSATNVSGEGGGVAVGWMPGGSVFVAHKVNADFSMGLGVLSYFGLAEDYDDNWAGRYYVKDSTLLGMTLMPAASYRMNDWLYLGAGLNIMYGKIESKIAINNAGETRPDGQLKYDDSQWGVGVNLGILVEPKAGTRFGLTYLSEVKLDFSAVPEFSGAGPVLEALLVSRGLNTSSMDLGITVPQMVMFSAYHEIDERWAVLGNVGWQDWSRFGKVDVGINTSDPTDLTTESVFNDTWHVALGTQYRHSSAWTYMCGIAYDSSAVDDDKRSVVLPMGETWRFGLGVQHALSPALSIGAAYEFAWLGDMPVDQERGPLAGRVSGEYGSSNMSFFAINMIWKY